METCATRVRIITKAMRLFSLVAAVVIPAAKLAAGGFYYNCEGDSGTFESPLNWYVENVVQATFPGESDEICCTNGLKTVRFETPGTTHRVARVTLDKNINNQKLAIDMNGGELHVAGTVAIVASRYAAGVVQPYFCITNGTLYADSGMDVGRSDNNYHGIFEAFGPDTHVVMGTGKFTAKGYNSTVNIGGGASVTWAGKGYLSMENGNNGYFTGEDAVAKFDLTGAGTTLECTNGFRVCNNARLRVADKAVVEMSGFSTVGEYGHKDRNSIGIEAGVVGTSGAVVEIDDATFSITNGACVMVAESSSQALAGHEFIVKNGGTFNFSGNTQFFLGFVQNPGYPATNNCLRVYSGARFSSDGNEVQGEDTDVGSIMVGGSGCCYDNGIHVSNGVVSVNHITLGGNENASNNWLRIEGRASRILLNQKDASFGNRTWSRRNPALGIHSNARVEFVLGPDGFDNVPIEFTTTVGNVYGLQGEGQKAQIVVEERGFAHSHANESITLIKTLNANNREFLAQLASDAVVVADRECDVGEFSVSEDGTSLLYTTPKKSGMVIVVR